jgi:hypothetical protein
MGRIPVVLATAALGELVPAWRTIALTLTELGVAAFFISGIVVAATGASGPWFVLVAVGAGIVLRATDLESWALFMPGGLPGRVNEAFGRRQATSAAAAVLVERLFFASLVACVAGHYVVSLLVAILGLSRLAEHVAASDLATAAAASLIGGKQIRNHSIGLIDIKRTAQQALHGQRGARGLVGPAGPAGPQGPAGPAGSAGVPGPAQPSTVAYARVTRSGTLMAEFSHNIKQVNVVRTGAGQYCFRGLSISIKTAVASPASGGAIGATVNPPTANYSFVVSTFAPGGKRVDNAFYVQFA